MTVSRYMRNPDSVAQATRQKIAEAIDTLGYIQNRAPSMLSRASSKAIGIVIPSLSNQVFASLVQGIESITGERGYDTLLAHTGYDAATEEEKIATLLSYQVDGLILTETHHTPRTLQMLAQAGIPVVEAMELPPAPIDIAVGLDHRQAAYTAVNRLISSGCEHIAYLAARLDTRTLLRRDGYHAAINEAGLTAMVIETSASSSFSVGRDLMNESLAKYGTTDGIFCTNDDLAVGAMLCCLDYGLQVPQDIRIIGYNGLDIGQTVTPALTSVRTPRFDIGQHSARLLLDTLAGLPIKQKTIDVGFDFTAGDSA